MSEYLIETPSIEDLVYENSFSLCGKVTRCGDCKYYNLMWKGCVRNPCVEEWHEDDFCSYGEREEEDEWDD